ncbi:MAG: recombination regulator RecX [Eubacterium sp.]|nr:recombination regulator RecX [Eubacterium sp.]
MLITKLEPFGSRVKIYINNDFAFVLYKGEINKYGLKEGQEIPSNTYSVIMNKLFDRGKERALYMLDKSYKTKRYIMDKLKAGLYPESIIDKVVVFLEEINLINDLRYAEMYIDYKRASKSKKQIVQDLYVKGVDKKLIDQAFEESDFSDKESLTKYIEKRKNKYDLSDRKDIQKFYSYLVSKGYSYGDVKEALKDYIDE